MPTFILTGKDMSTREGWLHEDGREITEAEWMELLTKRSSVSCLYDKKPPEKLPLVYPECVVYKVVDIPPEPPPWIRAAAVEIRVLAGEKIVALSVNDSDELAELDSQIIAIIARHAQLTTTGL